MSEYIMSVEGKIPKCEMSMKKCLGCALSKAYPGIMNLPPRITCILDDHAYIEITKCIKEA